jgi:hypothetical protein
MGEFNFMTSHYAEFHHDPARLTNDDFFEALFLNRAAGGCSRSLTSAAVAG